MGIIWLRFVPSSAPWTVSKATYIVIVILAPSGVALADWCPIFLLYKPKLFCPSILAISNFLFKILELAENRIEGSWVPKSKR